MARHREAQGRQAARRAPRGARGAQGSPGDKGAQGNPGGPGRPMGEWEKGVEWDGEGKNVNPLPMTLYMQIFCGSHSIITGILLRLMHYHEPAPLLGHPIQRGGSQTDGDCKFAIKSHSSSIGEY